MDIQTFIDLKEYHRDNLYRIVHKMQKLLEGTPYYIANSKGERYGEEDKGSPIKYLYKDGKRTDKEIGLCGIKEIDELNDKITVELTLLLLATISIETGQDFYHNEKWRSLPLEQVTCKILDRQ